MIRPDKGLYPITQYFGENPQIYSRFGLSGHNGWDIGCPNGTILAAPHNGNIIEIAEDPDGYGIYVKIENSTEGSLLAHNKKILVKIGDYLDQGQAIAVSNSTGFSTGPHSHWGYFRTPRDRKNGYNGYIDPTPYFNESDIITEDMPTYLKTLFQENGLTFDNESNVREFFEKARRYNALKTDFDNCRLTNNQQAKMIQELQNDLKNLSTSPSEASKTADLSLKDILVLLIHKLFK